MLRLVWLCVVAGGLSAQGIYHRPVYLTGGYGTTSSVNVPGLFLVDAGQGTVRTLLALGGNAYGFRMDTDNRHLLVLKGPPERSLLRVDPETGVWTTVFRDPDLLYLPYKLHVDPDGNYILGTYARLTAGPPARFGDLLLRYDPQAGRLETLATTVSLGRRAYFRGVIRTDLDSGDLLICDTYAQTTTTTIRYPVLRLGADGVLRSWSTGGTYGWYGFYQAPQDHATGELRGPDGAYVYRLPPGSASRSTVGVLSGYPTGTTARVSRFDLQTAPRRRWVALARRTFPMNQTWLFYVDSLTALVTPVKLADWTSVFYDLEFYRGRHVQTVRLSTRRWAVRLSFPDHPGRPYVVVLGLSGVRPGFLLADGRRVFLNPDGLTLLSLANLLPRLWDPGPGRLDAAGEGRATLDLSALPPLGWPLWLQALVLDPRAPGGVAVVPEVRVLRI